MKKVFAFALAMAMTLGLASCGSENSPAASGGSAASGGADVVPLLLLSRWTFLPRP